MGFTKLDRGILQSSILAEDSETFKVWIVFLAACDPDGIARVSPVFVSSVARLPQGKVDASIRRLSSPDPSSRSKTEKGRRIRRVDGGFFLINYQRYRNFTYSINPESVRKREYRERLKREGGRVPDVSRTFRDTGGHSPSSSSSSSLKKRRGDRGEEKKGSGILPKNADFDHIKEVVDLERKKAALLREADRYRKESAPGRAKEIEAKIQAIDREIADIVKGYRKVTGRR